MNQGASGWLGGICGSWRLPWGMCTGPGGLLWVLGASVGLWSTPRSLRHPWVPDTSGFVGGTRVSQGCIHVGSGDICGCQGLLGVLVASAGSGDICGSWGASGFGRGVCGSWWAPMGPRDICGTRGLPWVPRIYSMGLGTSMDPGGHPWIQEGPSGSLGASVGPGGISLASCSPH